MPAIILLKGQKYSPDEFAKHDLADLDFPGFLAGQQFIQFWQNNKQFFDQKTSGSTGNPTIHQISRQRLTASAERTSRALDLKRSSKALVCINMAYIGGKMMLVRGLLNNWELTLTPPNSDLSEHVNGPFDFAAMVPLQVQKLCETVKGKALLNQIDKVIIGGAAVSKALTQALQELDCRAYATYGMTETVSHVALQPLNGSEASPYFTMLDGVDFGTDERDCLKLRADVTDGQWIQTNDRVAFKTEKQFQILGRADNVINTGGIKVQTEILEAQIADTGLLDSQAFAVSHLADEVLGQKIVLIIESDKVPQTDFLGKLKAVLPAYHAPKAFYSVSTLPKTASDKLDRPALRNWLQEKV